MYVNFKGTKNLRKRKKIPQVLTLPFWWPSVEIFQHLRNRVASSNLQFSHLWLTLPVELIQKMDIFWKGKNNNSTYKQVCSLKYLAVHLWVPVDICCHNLNQLRAIATARSTLFQLVIHSAFTSNGTLLLRWKVCTDVHLQLRLEYHDQYGEAHSYSHAIRQAEKKCG